MAQKKVQKSPRSQVNMGRSDQSVFRLPFFGVLIVTVLVYILRGMGVLSFLFGGVLLILMGLILLLGFFYGIDKTRRF